MPLSLILSYHIASHVIMQNVVFLLFLLLNLFSNILGDNLLMDSEYQILKEFMMKLLTSFCLQRILLLVKSTKGY